MAKLYNQLTDAEKRQLTMEQVNDLIDQECALNGIPLLPKLPEKPAPLSVEPDLQLYEVAGFLFQSAEAAQRVLTAINEANPMRSTYNSIGSYKVAKFIDSESSRYERPTIESGNYVSEELQEKYSIKQKEYEQVQSAYDKAERKIRDIRKEREDIESPIWEDYNMQVAIVEARKQVDADFVRYVELSKGDEDVAKNMMQEIYRKQVEPDTAEAKAYAEWKLNIGKQ